MEINTVIVNGITYVPENSITQTSCSVDGLECVVVRTHSAGVFYGYLKERNGQEVTLLKAKRIFEWYGAASLSQLAVDGVSQPQKCKIPVAVPLIILLQAIEIIPLTEKAFKSLESVPVWKV